jgi:hypothetical protein
MTDRQRIAFWAETEDEAREWARTGKTRCTKCGMRVRASDPAVLPAHGCDWRQRVRGETPPTVLTSADPEPPAGTFVRDHCDVIWASDGCYPTAWVRVDRRGDPETWTKVAGNYGPVTVLIAP